MPQKFIVLRNCSCYFGESLESVAIKGQTAILESVHGRFSNHDHVHFQNVILVSGDKAIQELPIWQTSYIGVMKLPLPNPPKMKNAKLRISSSSWILLREFLKIFLTQPLFPQIRFQNGSLRRVSSISRFSLSWWIVLCCIDGI